MPDIDVKEEIAGIKTDIAVINRRLDLVEAYDTTCDALHQQHNEYRRSTDDKIAGVLQYQKSSDETLKKILGIIEEHLPSMERTKNDQIARDVSMKWVGSATVLLGLYLLLKQTGLI